MRTDVLFVLTAFLGMSDALRRQCKRDPANSGQGWYYTTSIDNVNNVAADFCTSPNIVRQWNNIKGNLRSGVNVKVPCRTRTRDCKKNSASDGAYVVSSASSDTLNVIAADFCTTADHIQQMNSKLITNKDFIQNGWVIQVPCSWN